MEQIVKKVVLYAIATFLVVYLILLIFGIMVLF